MIPLLRGDFKDGLNKPPQIRPVIDLSVLQALCALQQFILNVPLSTCQAALPQRIIGRIQYRSTLFLECKSIAAYTDMAACFRMASPGIH
jgi:hypothetical protein